MFHEVLEWESGMSVTNDLGENQQETESVYK